jgi:hypothetical protein
MGKNRFKGMAGKAPPLFLGKSSIAEVKEARHLKFCFKHFARGQEQSFQQWEADGLLAALMDRFFNFSERKLPQLFCKSFKLYGSFPPASRFKHPAHVPEDAKWASMHLEGRPCIAGHMVDETFYIVYLDKDHAFFPWKGADN